MKETNRICKMISTQDHRSRKISLYVDGEPRVPIIRSRFVLFKFLYEQHFGLYNKNEKARTALESYNSNAFASDRGHRTTVSVLDSVHLKMTSDERFAGLNNASKT